MKKLDTIIKNLGKNPNTKEKNTLMKEFKSQLKRYETGDLKKFRKTAIYECHFKYYRFYSKSANKTSKSNSC